ncbi:MAG: RagB/SusD family nutrient uptake outer membrane protein, partial [Muribaculum sp.]|nr:RagB/SusD family nutrient uptake outer membrane protein [Muribaculum sp.]
YELYNLLQKPMTLGIRAHGYHNAYQEYFAMRSVPGSHPEDKETIWGAKNYGVALTVINQMPVFSDGHFKCGFVPTQEIIDAYDMLATGEPIYDLTNPYVDEKHTDININPKSGYNPADPYSGRDPRFYGSIYYNLSKVNTGVFSKTLETYNNKEDWMGNRLTGVGDGNAGNCSIDRSSRMNTRTGYYLCKYHGDMATATNNEEEGNWKYFRLGEVYLNYAEAAIEAGHVQEGLNLINAIRHRAGFDPAVDKKTSDQATARLYVRHERQVELAFEEHRFFDVRRWKTLGEEISEEKYKTGMWLFGSGADPSLYTYNRFNLHVPAASQSGAMRAQSDNDEYVQISSDPKWTLLPIPIPEVVRLVKLTGKPAEYWQNPLHYQEEDYSGIDTVIDNAVATVRVYVSGCNVTVVTAGEYRIVDMLGRSVAEGSGVSNVILNSGLYIATANGKSVKFAVK